MFGVGLEFAEVAEESFLRAVGAEADELKGLTYVQLTGEFVRHVINVYLG